MAALLIVTGKSCEELVVAPSATTSLSATSEPVTTDASQVLCAASTVTLFSSALLSCTS